MEISLAMMCEEDMDDIFIFENENRAYFEKTVPPRPEGYYFFDTFKGTMKQLIAEQENHLSYFYIIRNENSELAGRINLTDIDLTAGTAQVGYRIGEVFAGRQVASSALKLLLLEAAAKQLREIQAKTTKENTASQKVLLRNGFTQMDYDSEFIFFSYKVIEPF
ncbi:GNAT family N-acetyltransferase [Bacillus infantis]|uniref:GNAT family N-acetyltransferase n=1 Tax=Bacillus infantis TaxID=324767 RepID=UPI001CD63116|nr:GNAT family N-acetyltransferase [Bacillus infantis]MCA1038618.1 GNAT family N-acetyltransferase [Bacillus infantis]